MRKTVPGLKLRWAESHRCASIRRANALPPPHGDAQPVMLLQVARQGLADIPVIIGHGNDGDASIANG